MYCRNTIPRSGAKTARLCLVLAVPVQVVIAAVVLQVAVAGVGGDGVTFVPFYVSECPGSFAPVTPFVHGAVEAVVLWVVPSARVTDLGGPLHPVHQ